MKNLITVMLVVLCTTSCLTSQVRDKTLLPAIQSAWVGVRADVVKGGGMLDSELVAWDAAVSTGNFLGLDLQDLQMQAIAGVNVRLELGEIGMHGALIMRDRAASFVASVSEYMRSDIVVRSPMPTGPLTISRSSWALFPPPAIAARTR